jgi:hypothetical protein
MVHARISSSQSKWKVEFANPVKAAQVPFLNQQGGLREILTSLQDGTPGLGDVATYSSQVAVVATVPQNSLVDISQVTEAVKRLLCSHGQLFAIVKFPSFTDATFRGIAEFCDISTALNVINRCQNSTTVEVRLILLIEVIMNSLPIHLSRDFTSPCPYMTGMPSQVMILQKHFNICLSARDLLHRSSEVDQPPMVFTFSPHLQCIL